MDGFSILRRLCRAELVNLVGKEKGVEAMANRHGQFVMKNLIGGIVALIVLLSSVSAQPDGALSGTNEEPLPRALQIEDAVTSGTPFSWADADKVQNGMTEAEVVAILGKPYSRSESGDRAILIWSYTSTVGGSNAVAYRFLNGRVVGNNKIIR
jgi:outer membrane protein assembly factor BamE (lipoprotein component of BamABCDE complex)